MPAPLWKPGQAPYSTWLKTLTKEEMDQHLLERKQRKMIKLAMKEVVDAQQAKWITLFHNGALKLLNKALENGDAQSYAILYDRFIGKPTDTINTETDMILPWSDTSNDTKTDSDDYDEDEPK
jgi:hypothetical protein